MIIEIAQECSNHTQLSSGSAHGIDQVAEIGASANNDCAVGLDLNMVEVFQVD